LNGVVLVPPDVSSGSDDLLGKAIGKIMVNVLDLFLDYVAPFIVLLYLIIGGYKYMFSQGDEKQMQSAKATITWAIVGAIVIVLANLIVQQFIDLLTKQI